MREQPLSLGQYHRASCVDCHRAALALSIRPVRQLLNAGIVMKNKHQ